MPPAATSAVNRWVKSWFFNVAIEVPARMMRWFIGITDQDFPTLLTGTWTDKLHRLRFCRVLGWLVCVPISEQVIARFELTVKPIYDCWPSFTVLYFNKGNVGRPAPGLFAHSLLYWLRHQATYPSIRRCIRQAIS